MPGKSASSSCGVEKNSYHRVFESQVSVFVCWLIGFLFEGFLFLCSSPNSASESWVLPNLVPQCRISGVPISPFPAKLCSVFLRHFLKHLVCTLNCSPTSRELAPFFFRCFFFLFSTWVVSMASVAAATLRLPTKILENSRAMIRTVSRENTYSSPSVHWSASLSLHTTFVWSTLFTPSEATTRTHSTKRTKTVTASKPSSKVTPTSISLVCLMGMGNLVPNVPILSRTEWSKSSPTTRHCSTTP